MSAPAPTTARPARLVSAARQPLPARIQYGRPLSCTQSRSGKRSISAQSVQAEQQAASSNTEDRVGGQALCDRQTGIEVSIHAQLKCPVDCRPSLCVRAGAAELHWGIALYPP